MSEMAEQTGPLPRQGAVASASDILYEVNHALFSSVGGWDGRRGSIRPYETSAIILDDDIGRRQTR